MVLSLAILATACTKWPWQNCEKGRGDRVEEVRNFPNFHTFILDVPGEVILHHDTARPSSELVLFAQKNVLGKISTELSSGILTITFDDCFQDHQDLRFTLYTGGLKKIVFNSSSRLKTARAIRGDHFTVEVNGTLSADMAFFIDSLATLYPGKGSGTFQGYAHKYYSRVDAASSVYSGQLVTDSVWSEMHGSGYQEIHVVDYLNATISGSGNILYTGGADTLDVVENITGSGSLINGN